MIDQTGQICEACRGGKFFHALKTRCKKGSLSASAVAVLEAYVHQALGVRSCVNAFLSPSRFLRDKLLENGIEKNKIHYTPLFLPDDLFTLSDSDHGYLLFLGRIEPHKGIVWLVDAARRVPGAQIIMAGRLDVPLESMITDTMPTNVKYVGFKKGRELLELRKNARAVIVPSQWYENQPFTILEAFAMGKPVITTSIGGMRELVGDNERGLGVSLGDRESLASAMQLMYENASFAKELGKNAYEYCQRNHTAFHHYTLLAEIYDQVIQ
jgi:glycosyltransferase involved in cell wall biosynthesis